MRVSGAAVLVAMIATFAGAAPTRDSRTFLFTYAAAVSGLAPDQAAHVWIPLAMSNDAQSVSIVEQKFPSAVTQTLEKRWGNHLAHFSAAGARDGVVSFSIVYRVTRRECGEQPAATVGPDAPFLQADALAPLGGRPATLLAGKTLPADPFALSRALFDLVDDRMEYRKDKPGWGRGDAAWACDSGFGNCTDFHSLFISLARTKGIACRFEMGFAIPASQPSGDVGGYHCWAWCHPAGHGWMPVDISEANKHPDRRDYYFGRLDADRVCFTTGRDLQLEPPQHGPPVNFLIYPYVEVGDKPWPAEKVEHHFSFREVPEMVEGPK